MNYATRNDNLIDLPLAHLPVTNNAISIMNYLESQALHIAALTEGAHLALDRVDIDGNDEAIAATHIGKTVLEVIELRVEGMLIACGQMQALTVAQATSGG